ncbi:FAD/NAD(P)-binding domain-containing protein [Mollisia scopiformis]|uniref:FAD/NAD(P)-binding domain-containing protein n=1 Tax=Mollisia scopiformis TaxID=149040 RepID=A0A194XGC4_MOLSC|nr:FAD/NAD(P)-binding domain-containing protein [Mollisia scopiformis]KUJ18827.1 FAD/NAD(P)-binding domain-containing protein [Mollisia scopiformis]
MNIKVGKDPHVLVIGAGITGLLIAQGLKKNGIKCSIFETESSASYRSREWTMGIHWAVPLLQPLLPDNIWQRLNTTQPDPDYTPKPTDTFSLYNGATGELLKTLPTGGMRRVSRSRMRALFSEGIEVNYGKTLSSISFNENGNGVFAHFSDGTSTSGDVLIGTDRPRSKVRDLIVREGSDASSSGVIMADVRSKYTAAQALELRQHAALTTVAFHPNGSYLAVFAHDLRSSDPQDWEFRTVYSSMPQDFSGGEAERLRLFKMKAAEYVGAWKNAIEWTPEGTPVEFNNLVYWKTVDFDNRGGRETLAGDAAHPMTPQRGQGLNHAVCDAVNLVSALSKVQKGEMNLKEAVTEYDTEMIKRGGDEMEAALLNTKMVHDWKSLLQSPLVSKSVARGN